MSSAKPKRASSTKRMPATSATPPLGAEVLVELDNLRAESAARAEELRSLQATLDKVRRERDALKLANEDLRMMQEENDEDLKWYMSQLAALQREKNEERVMRWLEGAQGLSSVRAAAYRVPSQAQPSAAPNSTDRSARSKIPPHCTDAELWLRGEPLPGDLEDLVETPTATEPNAGEGEGSVRSSQALPPAQQAPGTPGKAEMTQLRVSAPNLAQPFPTDTATPPTGPPLASPLPQATPSRHPPPSPVHVPTPASAGPFTNQKRGDAASRAAGATEMGFYLNEIWDKVQEDGTATNRSRNATPKPTTPGQARGPVTAALPEGDAAPLVASFRARIEVMEGQLAEAQSERFELLQDLEAARRESDRLQQEAKERDAEVSRLRDDLAKAEGRWKEHMAKGVRRELEEGTEQKEREARLRSLLARCEAAEGKAEALSRGKEEAEREREALRERAERAESELQASTSGLQQELREERLRGEKHRKKAQEMEALVAQASLTTQSYAEQVQRLSDQTASLQRELARHRALSAKRTDAEGQVASLLNAHSELEARYTEAMLLLEKAEVELREKEREARAREGRAEGLEGELGRVREALQRAEGQLQQQRGLTAQLDQQLSLTREKHDQTSLRATRAAALEEELQSTQLQLQDARAALHSLQSETAALESSLHQAEADRDRAASSLFAAQSDLQHAERGLLRNFVTAAIYRGCTRAAEDERALVLRSLEAERGHVARLQGQLDALLALQATSQVEAAALSRQIEEGKRTAASLQASLSARQKELEESRGACAALERTLEEERESARTAQYNSNRAGERVRDQEKAMREMERRVAEAEGRVGEVNALVQQVQEKLSGARAQATSLQQQVVELTSSREELCAKCSGLETKLFESQKRARLAEVRLKDLQDRLAKANAELATLRQAPPSTPLPDDPLLGEGEGGDASLLAPEDAPSIASQSTPLPSGRPPAASAFQRTPSSSQRPSLTNGLGIHRVGSAGSGSSRKAAANARPDSASAAGGPPSSDGASPAESNREAAAALESLQREVAAKEARIQALLTMAEERSSSMQVLQGDLSQLRQRHEEERAREKQKDRLIRKLYAEIQLLHQAAEAGVPPPSGPLATPASTFNGDPTTPYYERPTPSNVSTLGLPPASAARPISAARSTQPMPSVSGRSLPPGSPGVGGGAGSFLPPLAATGSNAATLDEGARRSAGAVAVAGLSTHSLLPTSSTGAASHLSSLGRQSSGHGALEVSLSFSPPGGGALTSKGFPIPSPVKEGHMNPLTTLPRQIQL